MIHHSLRPVPFSSIALKQSIRSRRTCVIKKIHLDYGNVQSEYCSPVSCISPIACLGLRHESIIFSVIIVLRCCHDNLFVSNVSQERRMKRLECLALDWVDHSQIWYVMGEDGVIMISRTIEASPLKC